MVAFGFPQSAGTPATSDSKAHLYIHLSNSGAVWRPEPGYRVVLNLSEARVDHAPPQADVKIRLFQLRAQYEF